MRVDLPHYSPLVEVLRIILYVIPLSSCRFFLFLSVKSFPKIMIAFGCNNHQLKCIQFKFESSPN